MLTSHGRTLHEHSNTAQLFFAIVPLLVMETATVSKLIHLQGGRIVDSFMDRT